MASSSLSSGILAAAVLLSGLAAFPAEGQTVDTAANSLTSWSAQIARSEAAKPAPSAAAAETKKPREAVKSAASSKQAAAAKKAIAPTVAAQDDVAKKDAAAKADASQARPAADKGEAAGQLQPQAHASNGGVTACFDSLARASSHVIDGEHQAFSFWDRGKPDTGTFRSIIALRYGSSVSPRGAAVIVNSPMQTSECDATTLQVMPTSRPCSAIQSSLIEKGRATANLTGLALIQTNDYTSYLLLPTAGDGCAIVSLTVIRQN